MQNASPFQFTEFTGDAWFYREFCVSHRLTENAPLIGYEPWPLYSLQSYFCQHQTVDSTWFEIKLATCENIENWHIDSALKKKVYRLLGLPNLIEEIGTRITMQWILSWSSYSCSRVCAANSALRHQRSTWAAANSFDKHCGEGLGINGAFLQL